MPQPHEFVPLRDLVESGTRPRFWRSLDPPPPDLHEDEDAPLSESSRRRFLSLMAASAGLAGLTACTRQPPEAIVPYVDPPENVIPGRPQYYATAVPVDGVAQGVIVESHLGRPTKVEGNPDHPGSLGATDVFSQASVLNLYDPDRAQQITYRGGDTRTWEEFWIAFNSVLEPIRARKGEGLRILTETVTSPSLGAQIQAVLRQLPAARWHQWSPAGKHSAFSGAQMAFGRAVNTYYRLDQADVIVALDSDFLTTGAGCTRYAHDFAVRRRRGDRSDMNRLYSVESTMTPTGGKADHRLPMKYADVEVFARELAAALQVQKTPGVGVPPIPLDRRSPLRIARWRSWPRVYFRRLFRRK